MDNQDVATAPKNNETEIETIDFVEDEIQKAAPLIPYRHDPQIIEVQRPDGFIPHSSESEYYPPITIWPEEMQEFLNLTPLQFRMLFSLVRYCFTPLPDSHPVRRPCATCIAVDTEQSRKTLHIFAECSPEEWEANRDGVLQKFTLTVDGVWLMAPQAFQRWRPRAWQEPLPDESVPRKREPVKSPN